ncbi:(Na+)-NQR maturation NqrM [Kushneria aurantia]|uniref:(Na+)-NQR maturation NqrM n=1 Tax=Kushneria aurantia TaxID=504092 RepID=A0ABV6G6U0_9GAMM|nr:(Na+)-NQR maturation NqrM [Kushneria aurantia]
MLIWLLVLGFMLLLVAAMSVGVLMGRKPISGSCGGLNKLGLKEGCDICGGKDEVCEERQRRERRNDVFDAAMAVDAGRPRGAVNRAE